MKRDGELNWAKSNARYGMKWASDKIISETKTVFSTWSHGQIATLYFTVYYYF